MNTLGISEEESRIRRNSIKSLFRFVFGKKTISDVTATTLQKKFRIAYTPLTEQEKLPCEITLKIYNDHFRILNQYTEIMTIVNSKESINLNGKALVNVMYNVLKNKKLVTYLCEHQIIFRTIYKQHIEEGNKSYDLLNTTQSICLCWLMYLYH